MSITQLYGDEYPDEQELLWEYISESDFGDVRFMIVETDVNEYFETIEDSLENMEDWQKELINDYKKDITSIKDKPIVIDSNEKVLLDGHHRIVALKEAGVEKVKALDLWEEE